MSDMQQRGATLTSYSLILATLVVLSLGAIQSLDRSSTEFLENTSDAIGEARPTRAELVASIEEEDPNGGGPIVGPGPGPTPTYNFQSTYEGIVSTPAGFCVADSGGALRTVDCSADSSASLEFFDNANDTTDHVQLRVGGQCVTRDASNSEAILAPCQDGNDDQMWLQTASGNLANAGVPGQCLDIEGSKRNQTGARVFSWGCHGASNQTFDFPGPYVAPPAAAVLAVNATDAALTGAFVIDGDGFVVANGTGYNGTPGQVATATFRFTVAEAGQYRIAGTVIAPNGGDDSFWVTTSIDGNNAAYLWDTKRSSTPTSDNVNNRSNGSQDVVITVPAGTSLSVVVSVREDGTRLGDLTLVKV